MLPLKEERRWNVEMKQKTPDQFRDGPSFLRIFVIALFFNFLWKGRRPKLNRFGNFHRSIRIFNERWFLTHSIDNDRMMPKENKKRTTV